MNILKSAFITTYLLSITFTCFSQESTTEPAINSTINPANPAINPAKHSKAEIESIQPYSNLPLKQVSNLAKVFDLIKTHYVEEIEDDTLLKYAIEGMVEQLDPHSAYFDSESLQSFTESTSGKFSGLGIEITMENGLVKVIAAMDGSPAQQAGLQSGDLIYELDSQIVQGMSLREASEIMRGKIGSKIQLKAKRPGQKEPLTFNIIRAEISNSSVKSFLLNNQIGYAKISSFQSETGNDFEKAILDMQQSSDQFKAIILDLRNNPGGLLQQAIKVSDIFLEEKLVVYTQGRSEQSKEHHYTSLNTIGKDLKVIVLINQGSASASEIVAGALQDHKRAVIMGQTSFGKASVQQILNLDDSSAIKLTIARYFTPLGRTIQAHGIKPDITIIPSVVSKLEDRQYVSESQLSGHLEGDLDQSAQANNINNLDVLTDDYQLQQAFQLLQGALIL
ncbi:S41 family peptidase [Marinicellulosiphila megalodicopiae]|uniref:S41 family peptidase n=1 Tax=Marinicellulosiphila megalodicopiae TaxID=2724896 RepID=UPI003BB21B42